MNWESLDYKILSPWKTTEVYATLSTATITVPYKGERILRHRIQRVARFVTTPNGACLQTYTAHYFAIEALVYFPEFTIQPRTPFAPPIVQGGCTATIEYQLAEYVPVGTLCIGAQIVTEVEGVPEEEVTVEIGEGGGILEPPDQGAQQELVEYSLRVFYHYCLEPGGTADRPQGYVDCNPDWNNLQGTLVCVTVFNDKIDNGDWIFVRWNSNWQKITKSVGWCNNLTIKWRDVTVLAPAA